MAVTEQEFKVGGRGMVTRAMIEVKYGVGCIGKKGRMG
jgi:hypothetical protein